MERFKEIRVALWAGEEKELASVENIFSRLGSRVQRLTSLAQAQDLIRRGDVDLIIVSFSASCTGPFELPSWLKAYKHAPRLLVVVHRWQEDLYHKALREGAFDAIVLPLDERELIRIASRALERDCMQMTA